MKEQISKVSVIIPVYKTEKYVKESVLSVVNQNYKNIEIILINDGSPDNAPQICDELSKEYEIVSVIHQTNGGLSSARNSGIMQVSKDSKYLIFLDSDDTILPNAISEMVKIADEENSDVVMPNKYISVQEKEPVEESEQLLFPPFMCHNNPKQFVLHTVMQNCRGWRATGILYKIEIIKANNCLFPIGKISEDVVFNLQFLANAYKIDYYDKPTIRVLKREGSITHTFQEGFEETIYYIDQQGKNFLEESNLGLSTYQDYLDSMLCRNLVVYLFSIMSSKNSMKKSEKKKYAKKLLSDNRNRKVFRKRFKTPWFESKKTRIGIGLIYKLLRLRLEGLALSLLSLIA